MLCRAYLYSLLTIFLAWRNELLYFLLILQVSVGYFVTDLAMILWLYPSLGGMEYVSLLLICIIYSLF
jgi:hypothetical protein